MFQTMMEKMAETMTNQMNKLVESNAKISSDANLIEESSGRQTEKITTELLHSNEKLTQAQKLITCHKEQVNILFFIYYFFLILTIRIMIFYFSVNLGLLPMKRVLNRHSMISIKNWSISKRKKSNLVAK